MTFDFNDCDSKRSLLLFDRVVVNLPLLSIPSDSDTQQGIEAYDVLDRLLASDTVYAFQGEFPPEPARLGIVTVKKPGQTLPAWADTQVIRMAQQIPARFDERVVPLLRSQQNLILPPAEPPLNRFLYVVLGQLPLPGEDTPWDAIFDWRHDDDARAQYHRLLAWLGRAARSGFSAADVNDELAAMLNDYSLYMTSRHRRFLRTSLGVLFTTTAEILEDAVSFKFTSAVKKLCELLSASGDVTSNDLNAPGREAAFITNARKRFLRPP